MSKVRFPSSNTVQKSGEREYFPETMNTIEISEESNYKNDIVNDHLNRTSIDQK